MPKISVAFAESLAPSPGALANAKALVKSGAIEGRTRTADESLVFARCAGSGKEPYFSSADLSRPESPVLRCSCPSRQLPCKHAVALVLSYASGQSFSIGEAPPELIEKREKAEARAKKAAERKASGVAAAPKKVNVSALKKKIEAQIEGLESLAATIRRIGATGIGTLTPEYLEALDAQAMRLGDAYLPGPLVLLKRFIAEVERGEAGRSRAVDELCLMRALTRKGIERCRARLADPEHKLDPESSMDEWLGHAWQLGELEAAGLVRADAQLVQLSFAVYDDKVKKEYSESGLWIDLADGRIFETRNLRPYKAVKHIKAQDSFFRVAKIPQLCVYPGGLNPRVRWEGFGDRDIEGADLERILEHAAPSAEQAAAAARSQMKNALLPPNPAILLRFSAIGYSGIEAAALDPGGASIALRDGGGFPLATSALLRLLPGEALTDGALLARFFAEDGRLFAQPLAVVCSRGIARLAC